MEETGQVAIFWDYENCAAPSSLSGYELVRKIRDLAHEFGSVKLLKAYTELSEQSINSPRSIALRSELQSSGVSITDCPHNGYKNVADQMIIADMLTFAMDNPTNPSNTTILLMSGDRDFAYPLSVLRLRRYNVVVVAPSVVHPSLQAQASRFFEWSTSILGVIGRNDSFPYPNNPFQSARGRPRSYEYGDVVSPSLTTTPTGSLSRPAFPNVITAQAARTPASSLGSQSSNNSKEDSKLLRSPIKSHVSAPSPSVMPSSAGPPPSTRSSSSLSYECSRTPETETSPPGYSSITAESLPPNRNHNGGWMALARPINTQPSSSSTLLPSPSSPPSAQILTNETKSVAPTPVSIASPNLPRVPLPSFARPISVGPSFPRTNSSLGLASPKTSAAVGLEEQAPGNVPEILSPHSPSPCLLSPATGNVSTLRLTVIDAESGVLSGEVIPSLQSAVSQLPKPSEPTLPQVTALSNTSEPASSSPVTTPTPVPAPPLKSIPPFFLSLVQHLEKLRLKGILNPLRSVVSLTLIKGDKELYRHAGCTKWKDFADKAEGLGLIKLGGEGGKAWITVHPDLRGRIQLKS